MRRQRRSRSADPGQLPAALGDDCSAERRQTGRRKAALAAYPGGILDRVAKLSDGEYAVHNIGVNWPHHIFVNQDFKVIGAD